MSPLRPTTDTDESDLLFHYTSFASFLAILQSGKLWATGVQYLNDSQELLHAIGLAGDYVRDRLGSQQTREAQEALTDIVQSLPSVAHLRVFQFSFSEEKDLLSQWRAYCPNGGVSFGVRKSVLSDTGSKNDFRLLQCIYDHDQQRDRISRIMDPVIEDHLSMFHHIANGTLDRYAPLQSEGPWSQKLLELAPQLKHSSFQEEREWRLVSGEIYGNDKRLCFHTSASCLLPHIEIDIAAGRGHMPIESVVVAPHTQSQLVLNAVCEAVRSFGGERWTVRSSQVPYRPL